MKENEVKVAIRLSGFDIKPDLISKKTGLIPSEFKIKGDIIKRPRKDIVVNYNYWNLESNIKKGTTLEECVEDLLNKLNSHEEFFNNLINKCEGELGIVINTYGDANPGIHLNKKILKELVHFGLELDIDIYNIE
ncbi:DUF4279 domain-containing protein [Aureibacter tunicatorum]|uniref:DUF4279 domain-containing protein n=1 Tax=Aureibacter tunicatorum TaxID=866807 RepID=A0AAE4BUB2_9BACT|nr:DUF4279 domain-containing protein [Aureibacter tunicatorum]MDR6241616.1 hypothetical protein [Aureibacter tunicatorum]BDD07161.1 hypothetical protein AUTU_46440 [Aureibacter tunicatorum]